MPKNGLDASDKHLLSLPQDKWFNTKSKQGEDDPNEFGQTMPMTTAIGNIIKDYSSNQVLQELIQNCDDARARYVAFVLDKRECCVKHRSMLPPAMMPFTGPALMNYDSAMFKERDFKSLRHTGDSEKKMDPTSTGKFGLGFNSVYHITDLPMFLSGQPGVSPRVCLFEPHQRIFRDKSGAPTTGRMYPMEDIDNAQLGGLLEVRPRPVV